MAKRTRVAEILDPLVQQVAKEMEGRGEHDPLAHVELHLRRLVDELGTEPPTLDKLRTLQELGYLSEHSIRDELAGFHEVVRRAIDETMTPGWE